MLADAEFTVVLVTAPEPAAKALAQELVRRGVCGCVNVVPGVMSFYRWEGQLDCATEAMLVIKTTTNLLPRLREAIAALHAYNVPEILELNVAGGSANYLSWLRSVATGTSL